MKRLLINFAAIIFLLTVSVGTFAQTVFNSTDERSERNTNDFLGVKLKPEVQMIVKEVERKTGKKIYADFIRQEDFVLATSYIGEEDGVPYVLVDYKYENGDDKKLEAIITHELLHLRLTANGFPAFLFSDALKMTKGRAVDTEQHNINDLRSMIEHQIFKAEMEKFDLYKFVDLTGDVAESARNDKSEDGQSDSINYALAILEYQNAADIEEVRKIYAANGWTRALNDGKAIADIIATSNPKTAKDSETVFLKCLAVLYPIPKSQYYFKLTSDPTVKTFKRMIISISKKAATKTTTRRRGRGRAVNFSAREPEKAALAATFNKPSVYGKPARTRDFLARRSGETKN